MSESPVPDKSGKSDTRRVQRQGEKSDAVASQQVAGNDNTERRHDSNKVCDDRHQVRQRILDRLHLEEVEREYSTNVKNWRFLKAVSRM